MYFRTASPDAPHRWIIMKCGESAVNGLSVVMWQVTVPYVKMTNVLPKTNRHHIRRNKIHHWPWLVTCSRMIVATSYTPGDFAVCWVRVCSPLPEYRNLNAHKWAMLTRPFGWTPQIFRRSPPFVHVCTEFRTFRAVRKSKRSRMSSRLSNSDFTRSPKCAYVSVPGVQKYWLSS